MKRRVVVLILLTVTGGLTMGPLCWPEPEEGPEALQVIQAICDLDDPDNTVVRRAIDNLTWLTNAPNIGRAINPLISILQGKNERHDSYTRALSARALVIIG